MSSAENPEYALTISALARFFDVGKEPLLGPLTEMMANERRRAKVPPNPNWLAWPKRVETELSHFRKIEDIFVEPRSLGRTILSFADAGMYKEAVLAPFRPLLWDRNIADSMLEGKFLHETGSLRGVRTVLDIGPGYGRLTTALAKELPDARFILCDNFLISHLCCAHMLRKRFPEALITVGADGLKQRLQTGLQFVFVAPSMLSAIEARSVDLAINIHSMDEMSALERKEYFSELERLKVRTIYLKNRFNTYSLANSVIQEPVGWKEEVPSRWLLKYERHFLNIVTAGALRRLGKNVVWQRVYSSE